MGLFSRNKGQKYFSLVNNQVIEIENINSNKPSINNKTSPVKFFNEDGEDFILFNDKKYTFEIIEQRQNNFLISVEGILYNISVESEFSLARRKILEANKQVKNIFQLSSPMPGKIIDILVEEGTRVAEGDSLLILEAMKMQNEIVAPVSGVIKKINIRPEQNIMKDDVLLIIE